MNDKLKPKTACSACWLKKYNRPNSQIQQIIWALFLPILALWYFVPAIWYSILVCMIAWLWIAQWQWRKWCDWFCPRWSFLDAYVMRLSPQKKLPNWFYSYKFRLSFIWALFTFLLYNIYNAYPDLSNIWFAFVKTLTITTILSLILALIWRARSWCVICPVWTMSWLIWWGRWALKVDIWKCINCSMCEKVCPMWLAPYKDKSIWTLQSKDCIRCWTCIKNCPVWALRF